MAQGVKSVTVALRSGVSDATLPNNVKMVSGKSYAISMADYRKISRSARDSIISATMNTNNNIVPLWNAAGFVLDLDTINNKSTIALVNSDAQALLVDSGSVSHTGKYVLGQVVEGFNGTAFKLVKVDSSSSTVAAGTVVVWGGVTTRPAAGMAATTVTSDFSDITDFTVPTETLTFAGVSIGTITAGNYGWIQVEGIAEAVGVDSDVTSGDAILLKTASTDGRFSQGLTDEVQTATIASFGGTDSFKLTFGGQESAAIVRGTNAAASDVQTAFQALSTVGSGNCTVTGTTDAGPYVFTFVGTLAKTDVGAITVTSGVGCTGTVTEDTKGGALPTGAGAKVGSALTDASSNASDVELRDAGFANRHVRTRDLFARKN